MTDEANLMQSEENPSYLMGYHFMNTNVYSDITLTYDFPVFIYHGMCEQLKISYSQACVHNSLWVTVTKVWWLFRTDLLTS